MMVKTFVPSIFLFCIVDALSIDFIVESLQNLLLEPGPAKGIEFPSVPGPRREDRVCIVGAGPSGVHMAMKLKKMGHKDVTIFEKTDRVGGKSYDVKYRGVYYPMGTIFAEPSYFDNMVPLAREYGVGQLTHYSLTARPQVLLTELSMFFKIFLNSQILTMK